MLDGIVKINLYPLVAQMNANAIPVFPEVGSITVVPEFIFLDFSASLIIASPILSFTEPKGLKNSNFAIISPFKLYFF